MPMSAKYAGKKLGNNWVIQIESPKGTIVFALTSNAFNEFRAFLDRLYLAQTQKEEPQGPISISLAG